MANNPQLKRNGRLKKAVRSGIPLTLRAQVCQQVFSRGNVRDVHVNVIPGMDVRLRRTTAERETRIRSVQTNVGPIDQRRDQEHYPGRRAQNVSGQHLLLPVFRKSIGSVQNTLRVRRPKYKRRILSGILIYLIRYGSKLYQITYIFLNMHIVCLRIYKV